MFFDVSTEKHHFMFFTLAKSDGITHNDTVNLTKLKSYIMYDI